MRGTETKDRLSYTAQKHLDPEVYLYFDNKIPDKSSEQLQMWQTGKQRLYQFEYDSVYSDNNDKLKETNSLFRRSPHIQV